MSGIIIEGVTTKAELRERILRPEHFINLSFPSPINKFGRANDTRDLRSNFTLQGFLHKVIKRINDSNPELPTRFTL